MKEIDSEVLWYYERGLEHLRLDTHSRLEAARTRHIIAKRIPDGALRIADVGGGPGAYAFWLAEGGHVVDLVDPVKLHLEQAARTSDATGIRLAGMHLAGAEALPFEDASFDVVLSLGPLYHLPDRDRRIGALREARRVLRPGGILFAAAIGRYASAIDGFFRGYVADDAFVEMMRSVIVDGQHRNPNRSDGLFTTSYFHRSEELGSELEASGFAEIELLGIEGIWKYIPEFERKWGDERFRTLLMETMEKMEADPSAIEMGGHLMGVGRKG